MSSTAPDGNLGAASVDARDKSRRPRRTLQSGFSLLSRGEPKIWLTGGMLVICLTMIISLLSLIVINGLATFWPGRIDWLMLANQEMDIGELQKIEVAPTDEATDSVDGTVSVAALPGAIAEKQRSQTSRFYRTANFDVTGRHYRWFEPRELDASGIVQPEWALVIERLSWGRLFGLPSRLAIPLAQPADSQQLTDLLATENLIREISSQPEPRVTAADGKSADAIEVDVTPSTSPLALKWPDITAQLTRRLAAVRSQQLKDAILRELQKPDGPVLLQATDSQQWTSVVDQAQLDEVASIADARVAWDDPEQILEHMAPVVEKLTRNRRDVLKLMRQISILDRGLSDARVSVRQAELDTGREVLEAADRAGALVETVTALKRLKSRVQAAAGRAAQDFVDADQAREWQRILADYQETTLGPQSAAASAELDAWRAQFENEPPAVQTAVLNFERVWHEVLEQKAPLEQRILALNAAAEGFELAVTVPTDAIKLEIEAADLAQLEEGNWSSATKELLAAEGVSAPDQPARVQQLNDRVSAGSFVNVNRGRQWLWVHRVDGLPPALLLPPQRIIDCKEVVRIFPANRLSLAGKLAVYATRWTEFLLDDPREANTEGGVFPAIWGTVVMTLIMTLAVVPFGVIAALYLREYTRSGPLVSLVRISINNLAGVPSIVYGVFGLAFFCYAVGAFIDGGPKNAEFGILPSGSWYFLLAVTAAVGFAAFMIGLLSSGPDHSLSTTARWLRRVAPWLWMLSLIGIGTLIFKSPFFNGFYEARLPTPTFGKEGLLWAALTLSLLTLPVVIVATEEALAAVPNSLREGSLACGASKWQTIHRIVLPHARPGILTGAILAMARGIGEVAPLMLVGALPVAPDLPLDGEFPYFHGSRSFMHLGYQIYWLGFQSQNSEASKPLVFTCTLLLILIVVALNLSAILLRARLRRRFQGNQF